MKLPWPATARLATRNRFWSQTATPANRKPLAEPAGACGLIPEARNRV